MAGGRLLQFYLTVWGSGKVQGLVSCIMKRFLFVGVPWVAFESFSLLRREGLL